MKGVNRDLLEKAIRQRQEDHAVFKTDPTGDRTAELENVLVMCSLYRIDDAENVVRCKDCRFWGDRKEWNWCRETHRETHEHWYCSDGLRRKE